MIAATRHQALVELLGLCRALWSTHATAYLPSFPQCTDAYLTPVDPLSPQAARWGLEAALLGWLEVQRHVRGWSFATAADVQATLTRVLSTAATTRRLRLSRRVLGRDDALELLTQSLVDLGEAPPPLSWTGPVFVRSPASHANESLSGRRMLARRRA